MEKQSELATHGLKAGSGAEDSAMVTTARLDSGFEVSISSWICGLMIRSIATEKTYTPEESVRGMSL